MAAGGPATAAVLHPGARRGRLPAPGGAHDPTGCQLLLPSGHHSARVLVAPGFFPLDADPAQPHSRRPQPAARRQRARRPVHAAGERPRHRRRGRRRLATGGDDKRYDHQDAQNSAVAVTDGNGALVGAPLFDAWGNAVPGAQLGRIERYGYTGREPDASGLIYYRARYDDPTLARFTQRDPSGLAGGLNPYADVGNDPVKYLDPNGRVGVRPFSASHETAYGGDCLSANGYGDGRLSDAEVVRWEVEFGEGSVRLAEGGCTSFGVRATIQTGIDAWVEEADYSVPAMAAGALLTAANQMSVPDTPSEEARMFVAPVRVLGRDTMLARAALVGGEAAVAANSAVTLNASTIRFSRSNVRSSLPEITASMRANVWQGAPIDV